MRSHLGMNPAISGGASEHLERTGHVARDRVPSDGRGLTACGVINPERRIQWFTTLGLWSETEGSSGPSSSDQASCHRSAAP